jgi:O-antigen ligase
MRFAPHRVLLAVLVVGNAVAFAGVDPVTKLATAALALVLLYDLREVPEVPKPLRVAAWIFLGLLVVQLLPLPGGLRSFLQPGFSSFIEAGWRPLSLAPWATLQVAASAVIAAAVVLVSMRIAATRTGLPALLGLVAVTCGVLAILGLAGESGAPERVMLVRDNTGGGDAYGPYVNSNHFALGIELCLPAALVLLAVSLRNVRLPGTARQRAAVTGIAAAVVASVAFAAMLRSGSRGGVLFLVAGLLLTSPFWFGPRSSVRWRWLAAALTMLSAAVVLAWTRLDDLRDGFSALFVLEGAGGNTRWDIWAATWRLFERSPVVGSGLGSYRHVIGLDKPATGTSVLEHAHNDWLEWLATAGLPGGMALALLVVVLASVLRPSSVRRLRFEIRYALAGAAATLVVAGLHETVGFGLQTPLNRYLLAVWIGLVLGVGTRVERGRRREQETFPPSIDRRGVEEANGDSSDAPGTGTDADTETGARP